jgi:hypothetical protein|nr:MAG TPA: Minor Head Virion Protein G6P [Inoviridae sp.]
MMPALLGLLRTFGIWLIERLGKYLLGLGAFGVAYSGVNVLINQVFRSMLANIQGLGDGYQILLMAGVGEAVNVLLSACAFTLSMSVAEKVAK